MIKNNSIIVIIGPGRSGTSLLMQVLHAFKMDVSEEMIGAREHNERGAFEDKVIFNHQTELMTKITPDSMPPINDWLSEKLVRQKITCLTEYIKEISSNSDTLWGFKDPRTALFIPMWTRVFNRARVIPKYILATRNPADVVRSQQRSINKPAAISELFWLTKNTESLYHIGGNCFIVHYEDWFTDKAPDIAKQLLRYTGLEKFWNENISVSDTLHGIVKQNLNRAVYNDYEIKNRYVLKLHDQLLQCRGDQFERQALMDVTMECRRAMYEFSGWVAESQRIFTKEAREKEAREKLILEANKYQKKSIDLHDEVENLQIQISGQNKQIERQEKKIFSLQTSPTFQIGQIFVKAITKPGKNTLLLPFYLLRLVLASLFTKN